VKELGDTLAYLCLGILAAAGVTGAVRRYLWGDDA
jgi:hypothetical protein